MILPLQFIWRCALASKYFFYLAHLRYGVCQANDNRCIVVTTIGTLLSKPFIPAENQQGFSDKAYHHRNIIFINASFE